MANPEHLEILKQGTKTWNIWRYENPLVTPDLIGAQLDGMKLQWVNLSKAELNNASLIDADLSRADLNFGDLRGATICRANLNRSDMSNSDLVSVDIFEANLNRANLKNALLVGASLNNTSLDQANMAGVGLKETVLANLDLSSTLGLDECVHLGPSPVDYRTLMKSRNLPIQFLRGVGLPDNFINERPRNEKENEQYQSLFISYSTKDEEFANRLHEDLQSEGVRCWFAPKDMKIGDRIRQRIDESIREHDRLMIILSDNSLKSPWVEDEVESAMEEENKKKNTVLFPIRIDDAVMDSDLAWASKIHRSRHIGDFSNWKDHDAYKKAFDRLLRDLQGIEG